MRLVPQYLLVLFYYHLCEVSGVPNVTVMYVLLLPIACAHALRARLVPGIRSKTAIGAVLTGVFETDSSLQPCNL